MPIKQAGTCELYKNEQCGAVSSLRLPQCQHPHRNKNTQNRKCSNMFVVSKWLSVKMSADINITLQTFCQISYF